jgi:hypothetical protein
MRHVKALLIAAVSLVIAPAVHAGSAPAAAATPARESVTTTTAEMLAKLLDKEGISYNRDEDRLRHTYSFTDGRSQQVFLQPLSDLREVGIVEIYSWVMPLDKNMPAALGKRLLEESGSQKLGYFGIEEVDGKNWVFAYHNLPTPGLTSKALAATMITVAELADEMEKEQLGEKSDDF